jgi:hypothetical protein
VVVDSNKYFGVTINEDNVDNEVSKVNETMDFINRNFRGMLLIRLFKIIPESVDVQTGITRPMD